MRSLGDIRRYDSRVLKRGGGFKGDMVTRISCPERHLLLDATTIHFD